MNIILVASLSLLTSAHNFNCETEIYHRFNSYLEESGKTYYEIFNRFDNDDNLCIDYDEMNILLRKIGVAWRCRWIQSTINYFDVLEKNGCVDWNEFKYAMRH